ARAIWARGLARQRADWKAQEAPYWSDAADAGSRPPCFHATEKRSRYLGHLRGDSADHFARLTELGQYAAERPQRSGPGAVGHSREVDDQRITPRLMRFDGRMAELRKAADDQPLTCCGSQDLRFRPRGKGENSLEPGGHAGDLNLRGALGDGLDEFIAPAAIVLPPAPN